MGCRFKTLPTPDFLSRDFMKDCSDSLLAAALRQSHRRSLEMTRDFAEQGVTRTTAYRVRIAGIASSPGGGSWARWSGLPLEDAAVFRQTPTTTEPGMRVQTHSSPNRR